MFMKISWDTIQHNFEQNIPPGLSHMPFKVRYVSENQEPQPIFIWYYIGPTEQR